MTTSSTASRMRKYATVSMLQPKICSVPICEDGMPRMPITPPVTPRSSRASS
ncbi:Uncharacterised protein [Bordetella pertussis]|nr:Uncharacterised protein [Bordetella pertussis]CFM41740.1 Uncharacterised protein [Bordetella pertussis]CFN60226.1 Uncharacterised protein [Bordetella pertussis]CFN77584.1 Uncharacterised protein [Bordetella pertussis]CFO27716.1 Uncharacterised protein [Bordetella pertussis]